MTLHIRYEEPYYYLTRQSPRETRTFRLRYNSCLYSRDDGGRRVDLFYTTRKDALLLVPGGSYERTTKLEKRHGQ